MYKISQNWFLYGPDLISRAHGIEYPLPPSPEASKLDVLENLWRNNLQNTESKKIYVERTFDNFDDFWQINAFSMAIKPIFDKLDTGTIEKIKTSIKNKISAGSSDDPVVTHGHVNAIKGIVWMFVK